MIGAGVGLGLEENILFIIVRNLLKCIGKHYYFSYE